MEKGAKTNKRGRPRGSFTVAEEELEQLFLAVLAYAPTSEAMFDDGVVEHMRGFVEECRGKTLRTAGGKVLRVRLRSAQQYMDIFKKRATAILRRKPTGQTRPENRLAELARRAMMAVAAGNRAVVTDLKATKEGDGNDGYTSSGAGVADDEIPSQREPAEEEDGGPGGGDRSVVYRPHARDIGDRLAAEQTPSPCQTGRSGPRRKRQSARTSGTRQRRRPERTRRVQYRRQCHIP